MDTYIMVGREAFKTDDILEWGRWFETADRHVGDDLVGPYRISTVFLGIDCNYYGKGPPILFETAVYALQGDEGWTIEERYVSFDQAEAGHAKYVAACTALYEAESSGDDALSRRPDPPGAHQGD
jgi:hypothetical protein